MKELNQKMSRLPDAGNQDKMELCGLVCVFFLFVIIC